MTLNSQGDGHVRIGFNRKYLAYVALIPANTSTLDGLLRLHRGYDGGPAYSCTGRGYYDYSQTLQGARQGELSHVRLKRASERNRSFPSPLSWVVT